MSNSVIINKVEYEFFKQSQIELELILLGIKPIPEDTRTERQKDLDNFKFALDVENKLYWENPKTGQQRELDKDYTKGGLTTRTFKRWARGMDI